MRRLLLIAIGVLSSATLVLSGTQNVVPKFAADGSATLNSQIYDSGSNVGVGTMNPQFTLDVVSPGGVSAAFRAVGAVAGSGSVILNTFSQTLANAIAGDAMMTNGLGNLLISPNATGKDLRFIGGAWNNPVSLIVKDGGNVGVGTTNPQYTLDVVR
jgi:hypothetical protein